eukprot:TRINITY_DN12787_c0_g1_i1.p1 TRINITY_DN12787_c0_g1~~TRINITY_DN12787_c0_g1_i1.p1  ORF type:complete len:267 (+),score=61.17 TRINITY_DN12787_c0_g1_i1:111-911(+)
MPSLVGSEMCIRDSINAEYMGLQKKLNNMQNQQQTKIKEESQETLIKFKVLLVGDSTVGKSSIIRRYIDNEFEFGMSRTVGVDYRAKRLKTEDKQTVVLNVWDTAGQEKFRAITQNFYKGADAIIFVFDLTNKSSFLQLNDWIESVHQRIGEKIKKIIVGNKKDLKWAVDEKEVKEKYTPYNINIYYTSAKTGENIETAFYDIMNQLYKDINLVSMKIQASRIKNGGEEHYDENSKDPVVVDSQYDNMNLVNPCLLYTSPSPRDQA